MTDDAIELMKSYSADITLEIDGQEKVIYKVTRPVVGYELHVMDAEGNEYNEENPIIVAYEQYRNTSFRVSANHTWALVEKPDWIDVKLVGYSDDNVNQAVCGTAEDAISALPAMVNTYQYLPREGKLVFKSEDGQFTHSVSVSYDGMPADKIDFSLANTWRTQCQFDVTGKILSSTSGMSSSATLTAPINFDVYARDGEYVCVLLDWNSLWGYTVREVYAGMTYWYNIKDDNAGHISLTVEENTGAERKGCIMVFPKTVYERVKDKMDDEVLDAENLGINWMYSDYAAIEFSQAKVEEANGGFTFTDQEGNPISYTDLNYKKATEEFDMSENELLMNYGTSNVYVIGPDVPYESLIAIPNGYTPSMWGTEFDWTSEGKLDGLEVASWYPEGLCIMGMTVGQQGYATISIYDSNGTFAVLIVNAWF